MSTLFYQFADLQTYITTQNTFTVSVAENVSVVLVQYATGCITNGYGCGVDLTYSLIPANGTCAYADYGPIEVNGAYKSQSDTIVFYNVAPGTYKLCIQNKDSGNPADGNGYIYY